MRRAFSFLQSFLFRSKAGLLFLAILTVGGSAYAFSVQAFFPQMHLGGTEQITQMEPAMAFWEEMSPAEIAAARHQPSGRLEQLANELTLDYQLQRVLQRSS